MKDTDYQVVRRIEARSFMEGPEHCREYFTTDKLTFGTSTLPPGQAGATDPGHPESHEVFFAAKGHVLVRLGDPGPHFELEEGDAILIPEGVSHTIINVGEETALIVWACAPVHRDPADKV
jgi:oxalate decarboxylase/phosphoglucose isomerase-like protein (cupin superfamily)